MGELLTPAEPGTSPWQQEPLLSGGEVGGGANAGSVPRGGLPLWASVPPSVQREFGLGNL